MTPPGRSHHPHRQLADDEGDGDRRSAAPRGRRGDRLRRRRARLRDARRRSTPRRTTAIDSDFTKYTPVGGIAELKRAICDRYRADYGVEYTGVRGHRQRRRQAGALQHGAGAVRRRRRGHHARAVLADAHRAGQAGRGDAGPRADARRRTASRSRPGAILDAITPRTRGIIINSPCNPTGALISEDGADGASPRGRARAASGSSSISATRS